MGANWLISAIVGAMSGALTFVTLTALGVGDGRPVSDPPVCDVGEVDVELVIDYVDARSQLEITGLEASITPEVARECSGDAMEFLVERNTIVADGEMVEPVTIRPDQTEYTLRLPPEPGMSVEEVGSLILEVRRGFPGEI